MKIEGYSILKEISRGPITTVFLGRQLALERPVLIKLLNTQWQNEPDLIERFRREAIICARLKHPNIVSIFNVGTEGDNLYLVIEYIEGEDGSRFVKQHHPIPFDLIIYIAREIINGLAYAHSRGIIHRDIKPGNIMVSREGSVKISDFGLARTEDLPALTAQGGTVGTPAYMSPEQARGKTLDQRSDLFSLGVTLYEMASGESPFHGENFADSIGKVLNDNPKPLRQIRSDIPDWFSELVAEMLNKDAQKRPASAREILAHPGASAREILAHPGFKSVSASGEQLASFIEDPSAYAPAQTVEAKPAGSANRPSRKRWGIAASLVGAMVIFLAIIFIRPEEDKNNLLGGGNSDSLKIAENITPVDSFAQNEPLQNDSNAQNIPLQQSADSPSENSQNLAASSLTVTKERLPENQPEQPEVAVQEDSLPDTLTIINQSSEKEEVVVEMGGVYVACSPWAEVFIDGQKKETTPLVRPIMLQPGEYAIELKNPGFASHRRQLSIQPGRIDTMTVNLLPHFGYLNLRVIPWAEIYINGQFYEKTPIAKPISLPAGKYELKLTNPNFQTYIDSISIAAGETLSQQVMLSQ